MKCVNSRMSQNVPKKGSWRRLKFLGRVKDCCVLQQCMELMAHLRLQCWMMMKKRKAIAVRMPKAESDAKMQ